VKCVVEQGDQGGWSMVAEGESPWMWPRKIISALENYCPLECWGWEPDQSGWEDRWLLLRNCARKGSK
jgi:hypothetical protein